MGKKYDSSKYEVSDDMPKKFATVIPGLGVQHFDKSQLSNNDCKALILAKSEFVKQLVSDDEGDRPEYHTLEEPIKEKTKDLD
jgi:hypothetical protein